MSNASKEPTMTTDLDDARWAAVRSRDKAADGSFVYSPSRRRGSIAGPPARPGPRSPANVAFHADLRRGAGGRLSGHASAAGRMSRASPACAMPRPRAAAPASAAIEAARRASRRSPPSRRIGGPLAAITSIASSRPIAGVTPKAYAERIKAERAKAAMATNASVTAAIYEAGYSSASRFYERAAGDLGMTPSAYRKGGEGSRIRFALGECSLGAILVAATEKGVCAITLGADPEALLRELQDRFPKADLVGGDADFERLVAEVVGLVERPARPVDLPLDIRGTAFQQRVWQALRGIPPGTTASYAEIAARIGDPRAVRAVARACAANEIAVAIPCHRVVRTDGALSGYRWGVERKRALLAREAA
jgi:AraC family transcriptional regulator of adaptative response/methylated-DNA-[protein]-cysteine methyltransferase